MAKRRKNAILGTATAALAAVTTLFPSDDYRWQTALAIIFAGLTLINMAGWYTAEIDQQQRARCTRYADDARNPDIHIEWLDV